MRTIATISLAATALTAQTSTVVEPRLAGYIYDELGSYAPAFMVGVVLNVANIAIIASLAVRRTGAPAQIAAHAE